MNERIGPLVDLAVSTIGGSRREGQDTMAEAVDSSLRSGTHLLVQAGTGTGKSLAYLVPALRHAVSTGETVVVSTATLALQSQIVARDLPRLVKAIAGRLDRKPTVALLKGRRNYVCRYKLDGGYPDEGASLLFDFGADAPQGPNNPARVERGGSRLGEEVTRIREWVRTTDTGDRDDLVPGVSARAWAQASVNAYDCLGAQKCPVAEDCFSERARRKAADADVVVTNHALLAINAFGDSSVLPEHDAVIVDEAHELADRVTAALTGQLTPSMLRAAATSLRRHTAVVPGDLERAADALDSSLSDQIPGLVTGDWPESLGQALTATLSGARQCLADMGQAKEDKDAGRQVVRARLQEIFELSERFVERSDNDVVWIASNESPEDSTPSLDVAPLSVAGTMRSGVFAMRTVIATSATLTLGGTFDPLAGSLGLAGPDAPRYDAVDVGSPFDYGRQGILYVAAGLPRPGRGALGAELLDELEELVQASDGGALGLFSSRRAAEEAAEQMRARLPRLPILLQGEDSLPALVRSFAADRRASLFGTMSLWQGVDVPGDTCRLVTIDRLPFPRPDDPIASARTRAADRRGASGFMAVSATHAAVRLAQGAGRLVRTGEDKGVVAVLDSRLVSARYGAFLSKSLPPMWRTTDGEAVRAALRRLAED